MCTTCLSCQQSVADAAWLYGVVPVKSLVLRRTYVPTYVRPAIVAAAVAIAHVWYGLIKRAPTDGSARSVWLLSA